MILRKRILLPLSGLMLLANGADEPKGSVDVQFANLRSAKGMIRGCLTSEPRYFPHCEKDPAARKASVKAGNAAILHFGEVKPGRYALSVIHDENENFKLDTSLGIPREGVGFSRNPKLFMSAPSFASVVVPVAEAPISLTVTLKYFL